MRKFLPAELVAGATWAWSVLLEGYDPAIWRLSIFLRGQGIKIDVVAVADPNDPRAFSFTIAATATDVTPGLASFQARITDGTTVTELARGNVTILANLEKQGEDFDPRSLNRQMLDKIKALLADKGTRLPIETQVAGRLFRYQTWKDLLEAEGVYAARVTRERIESGELSANYNQVVGTFGRRNRRPPGDWADGGCSWGME